MLRIELWRSLRCIELCRLLKVALVEVGRQLCHPIRLTHGLRMPIAVGLLGLMLRERGVLDVHHDWGLSSLSLL